MKEMKNRTRLPEAMQSVEELMETPTFKRFNVAIDTVLELAEDIDLTELNKGNNFAISGEGQLITCVMYSIANKETHGIHPFMIFIHCSSTFLHLLTTWSSSMSAAAQFP
jgi:hypothetical protein